MSRLLHAAVLALFLAPVSLAQPPSDDEFRQKVNSTAARVLTQPGAAGFAVTVVRNGEILLEEGFGAAEVEHAVPVRADSIFRIGSVTKQFTAAAVLRLAEQGKLSLDEKVQAYVPDFPEKQWPVTVRHLLTHTSGVWNYTADPTLMRREAAMELTPAEMIARFADRPLDFEPGTKFSYSNSGYYLLGEVIERVSGRPYAAYMQEEFFGPLGLTRTRYESNAEIIPGRAQGYRIGPAGKLENDRAIGAHVAGAGGSMLSSAGDLARWDLALAGGKVVKPESYALMTTSAVLTDGRETGYGMGMDIDIWEGRRRIAHGGGIFGFKAKLIRLPDDGVTVAMVCNSEALNLGDIADDIARLAVGVAVVAPEDQALSAEEIERFSGAFVFQEAGQEVRFFESGGKLMVQPVGANQSRRLLYRGGGEFRSSVSASVKFVFDENGDGVVMHQGEKQRKGTRKK
jgi:D-alanyl-D-alanine carboxypeptidase